MKEKKVAVIIDDDACIRDILSRVFTSLEYETKLYANALEMPCIVSPPPDYCEFDDLPDILITDVQMPGMSGIELLGHIKQKGCRIRKVALMSGFCNEGLQTAAKRLNCKHFTKPFSLEEIKEWVKE